MNKQITGLAKYIIKMAHNRHYNGRDKVMVTTMLEMADLLNQFAKAKDKQKQLDWKNEAVNMLLEKSYNKADSQARNELFPVLKPYLGKNLVNSHTEEL